MPFRTAKNILLWFLKPFFSHKKRYWRIVFLCFLAASMFWLLNALNKNYTTRIDYPVRFVYDDQRIIPLEPLPEYVQINVSGKGWKLLPSTLKLDTRPAELMLRNLPHATFIPGAALRPAISSTLDGLQLNFIITDTLFFRFDYRVQRSIPLVLDSTQQLTGPNYTIVEPVIFQPRVVTFTGPASIVDSLPVPFPIRLPIKNLSNSFRGDVRMPPVSALANVNVDEVRVTLHVAPLVMEQVVVRPKLVNFPAEDSARINPTPVRIKYKLRQGEQIDQRSFVVQLDYRHFNPKDSTIVPELLQQPPGLREVRIVPDKAKINYR